MKIQRAVAGSSLLVAAFFVSYPLLGVAAPGADGDHRAACGPPEFHGHGPMPPPPGGPGPGFGHGPGPEWGAPPPFLAGLKLTEDQQDKVFAIVYKAAPTLREQSKALHKAHEALMELSASEPFDESKAKSLADTAAKADGQLTLLRARTEHEIYAVLTPEQRKEVTEHRHEHADHERGGRPPA